MNKFSKQILLAGAALPMSFLVACGGSGGSSGTSGAVNDTTGLTPAIEEAPVAGQFLADCLESGTAVIDGFVGTLPLPALPADVPDIGTVLESGDPAMIPVIGGLVPGIDGGLVPVSIDDTLSMLPTSGLPADVPVLAVPVSCSDVALPASDLPVGTDALGLVPVLDDSGAVVALIVATVSSATAGGAPGVPALPVPTNVDVPTELLPEPLGSTIGSILPLLGL